MRHRTPLETSPTSFQNPTPWTSEFPHLSLHAQSSQSGGSLSVPSSRFPSPSHRIQKDEDPGILLPTTAPKCTTTTPQCLHNLSFRSLPPEATRCPSGLQSTENTSSWCPGRSSTILPVRMSHTFAVESLLAETTRRLSALQPTWYTGPTCPRKVRMNLQDHSFPAKSRSATWVSKWYTRKSPHLRAVAKQKRNVRAGM